MLPNAIFLDQSILKLCQWYFLALGMVHWNVWVQKRHRSSYDACRTDLLDSVNSTLQPYNLPNLSNAHMLKLIPYGDERLSVDYNSEILKATLRYIYATQTNFWIKSCYWDLAAATCSGTYMYCLVFFFSFPSYLLVVFIFMLNGLRVNTALCSLRYRF